MAQNALCGSLSMAQLNLLLRQISKSSQWEIFRRLMLVIFLISWFSMVMTSVYVRMSTGAFRKGVLSVERGEELRYKVAVLYISEYCFWEVLAASSV